MLRFLTKKIGLLFFIFTAQAENLNDHLLEVDKVVNTSGPLVWQPIIGIREWYNRVQGPVKQYYSNPRDQFKIFHGDRILSWHEQWSCYDLELSIAKELNCLAKMFQEKVYSKNNNAMHSTGIVQSQGVCYKSMLQNIIIMPQPQLFRHNFYLSPQAFLISAYFDSNVFFEKSKKNELLLYNAYQELISDYELKFIQRINGKRDCYSDSIS